jgi:hypothetical protein
MATTIYLALPKTMRSTASPSKAGTIHHLADTGEQGYAGDGGAARGSEGIGPWRLRIPLIANRHSV